MIDGLRDLVLEIQNLGDSVSEEIPVVERIDRDADFGIFIGIERSDAGFGGTVGSRAETFLFPLVEIDMIRHEDLRAV